MSILMHSFASLSEIIRMNSSEKDGKKDLSEEVSKLLNLTLTQIEKTCNDLP
mgnify:CR=1 FL=1